MNIYNNIDREKVQFDFVVTPEERKDLYSQVEQMGGRIFVCPKGKTILHTVSGGMISLRNIRNIM